MRGSNSLPTGVTTSSTVYESFKIISSVYKFYGTFVHILHTHLPDRVSVFAIPSRGLVYWVVGPFSEVIYCHCAIIEANSQ